MSCAICIFFIIWNPIERWVTLVLQPFPAACELIWYFDHASASHPEHMPSFGHLLYPEGCSWWQWSTQAANDVWLCMEALLIQEDYLNFQVSVTYLLSLSLVTNKHLPTQWWHLSESQLKNQSLSICLEAGYEHRCESDLVPVLEELVAQKVEFPQ